MISSEPSIFRPSPVVADARTSYIPGLRLSAAGGATAIVTLLASSSRANARLSAADDGHPAGAATDARTVAGAPRERFVVVMVKCLGSCAPPSIGHNH